MKDKLEKLMQNSYFNYKGQIHKLRKEIENKDGVIGKLLAETHGTEYVHVFSETKTSLWGLCNYREVPCKTEFLSKWIVGRIQFLLASNWEDMAGKKTGPHCWSQFNSISPGTGPLEKSYAKPDKICYKCKSVKVFEILYLLATLDEKNDEHLIETACKIL